jgi:imidazole glycerol-phosphate synthase subunit HisF
MAIPRVIPVLLLDGEKLVKTVKFKSPKYVGDPLNAVKIFNEKEVDELAFLDIKASIENRPPPLEFLYQIAGECFMPLSYGGGLRELDQIRDVLRVGIEKVVVNSHAVEDPLFVQRVADRHGSSTIAVSIDVKKTLFGKYEVYTHGGTQNSHLDPVAFAVEMDRMGAGELLLCAIDRDGTMEGYDLELVRRVSQEVGIPVIAAGGAGSVADFGRAVDEAHAAAAAAGSLFVFKGKYRAILISYPSQAELGQVFANAPRPPSALARIAQAQAETEAGAPTP